MWFLLTQLNSHAAYRWALLAQARPEPETLNLKPKTRNPKPETQNPKPAKP